MQSHSANHPSSLVDRSLHDHRTLELLSRRPNQAVYRYFAYKTVGVLRDTLFFSPVYNAIIGAESFQPMVDQFFTEMYFIGATSQIGMNVVLSALELVIQASKTHLKAKMEERRERRPFQLVFLASIFVALKNVNDNPTDSSYFSHSCFASKIVSRKELVNYEKAFLEMLGYQVTAIKDEHELLSKYYWDITTCYPSMPSSSSHIQVPVILPSQTAVFQNTTNLQPPPPVLPYQASHNPPMYKRSRTSSQPQKAVATKPTAPVQYTRHDFLQHDPIARVKTRKQSITGRKEGTSAYQQLKTHHSQASLVTKAPPSYSSQRPAAVPLIPYEKIPTLAAKTYLTPGSGGSTRSKKSGLIEPMPLPSLVSANNTPTKAPGFAPVIPGQPKNLGRSKSQIFSKIRTLVR